ncbi:MAG: hypothetical protein AB7E49_11825 [Campylobacterales bacterium]
MNAQERSELAFKAFRKLAQPDRQEKIRHWLENLDATETKKIALLLQVLIARDRAKRAPATSN